MAYQEPANRNCVPRKFSAEMPVMRDLSKLPSITPEMLANAPPPGASGAFRFSLDGVPEHEKAFLTREFFGRSVVKYDVERARDAAKFDIDVTLQMMPGLMMM